MNQKSTIRLKLLKSLKDKGFSTKEITNYLNSNNMKSPKGKLYTPKLVWVTLFKYEKRLKRLDDYKIVFKSEELCVIPSTTDFKCP